MIMMNFAGGDKPHPYNQGNLERALRPYHTSNSIADVQTDLKTKSAIRNPHSAIRNITYKLHRIPQPRQHFGGAAV